MVSINPNFRTNSVKNLIKNPTKNEPKENPETIAESSKAKDDESSITSSLDVLSNYNKGGNSLFAKYHFNNEDDFWKKLKDLEAGDYGTFIDENGCYVRFYMIKSDDGKVFPTFEYGKKSS